MPLLVILTEAPVNVLGSSSTIPILAVVIVVLKFNVMPDSIVKFGVSLAPLGMTRTALLPPLIVMLAVPSILAVPFGQ